jgi:hypothetical protein
MILKFKLLGSSVDAWEAPLEPVLLLVFRVLTNSKNKQFLQILVLLYLLTKFTIEPKILANILYIFSTKKYILANY